MSLLGELYDTCLRTENAEDYTGNQWTVCRVCGVDDGHEDACLVPRVLAALQAAERIATDSPMDSEVAQGGVSLVSCKFCYGELAHESDCSWQALVAALRGDG